MDITDLQPKDHFSSPTGNCPLRSQPNRRKERLKKTIAAVKDAVLAFVAEHPSYSPSKELSPTYTRFITDDPAKIFSSVAQEYHLD